MCMNSEPCKDLERMYSRQREQQVQKVDGCSKFGMFKEQKDPCGWSLMRESHGMKERMLEK